MYIRIANDKSLENAIIFRLIFMEDTYLLVQIFKAYPICRTENMCTYFIDVHQKCHETKFEINSRRVCFNIQISFYYQVL